MQSAVEHSLMPSIVTEMQDELKGRVRCVVVTPEKAVLDATAEMVILPMYDGELGVLPGRAPLIGRLGFGELRLREGEVTRRYFVDGGFADKIEKAKKFALRPGNHNVELRDSDGRTIYKEQVAVIVGKTTELHAG